MASETRGLVIIGRTAIHLIHCNVFPCRFDHRRMRSQHDPPPLAAGLNLCASLEVKHVPKRDTGTLERIELKYDGVKDLSKDRLPFLKGTDKLTSVGMGNQSSNRPTLGQHRLQDMNAAVVRQQSPQ